MSVKSHYQTLFTFHWHTNQRLMEGIAHLEIADFLTDSVFGHRSVRDLLFHILNTDRSWRLALESGRQAESLPSEQFLDLTSLKAGFEAEQQAWDVLLNAYNSEEIEIVSELTNRRGQTFPIARWRVLQHVILHGMQHHTELAQLLTEHGYSPGDIDFIFYQG